MDIKAEIEKVISSITKDGDLKEKFTKDPKGTVEGLLGKLPEGTVEGIVAGVQAKLDGAKEGSVADKLGDAMDKLGGLFKK